MPKLGSVFLLQGRALAILSGFYVVI